MCSQMMLLLQTGWNCRWSFTNAYIVYDYVFCPQMTLLQWKLKLLIGLSLMPDYFLCPQMTLLLQTRSNLMVFLFTINKYYVFCPQMTLLLQTSSNLMVFLFTIISCVHRWRCCYKQVQTWWSIFSLLCLVSTDDVAATNKIKLDGHSFHYY